MALGLLLRLVNFVGHGIVDTFSTCISLNYVLGERIVWLLNVFLSWVYSIVVTLLTAIKILLEDLLVFLKEGVDSILFGIECVFGLIDAVVSGVGGAANAVHQAGLSTAHSVSAHAHNLAQGLSDLLSQSAEFLNLLGASVMLLLNLVPRSLYLIFQTVTGLGVALWTRFRDLGSNSVEAFRSAPVEMFIGLLTGLVMMYLLHKVFLRLSSRARDLILEYEITPGQVLRIVAGSLAFVYLNFVRGVIFFFGTIFQVLVVSLANIHVPRFHHAVDSDNDDEVDHQGTRLPRICQTLVRTIVFI